MTIEFTSDPEHPFSDSLGQPEISEIELVDDGVIPNNALPLIVYQQAFDPAALRRESAALVQKIFRANNWVGAWVNGVFGYHHYHSTAHEVLGCFDGSAKIQFGGPSGITQAVNAGDVVVIPAGVAHKNCGSSRDFGVVGAYPSGQSTDLLSGKTGERPGADENIRRVPLPATDPVFGTTGPLIQKWRG